MGYVIDNSPTIINDNPIPLGIKSTFNGIGIFTTNYINSQQARDNFKNLLLTRNGERLYHPNFGCNLLNILFQPITDQITDDINTTIRNAVSYWLPYLSIDSIDIDTTSSDIIPNHTIKINIVFSLFNDSIETNTIVIFAAENGILRIE